MKMTELAKKKLGMLFGGEHEKKEWYFLKLFIYTNNLSLKGNGLLINQLESFCKKCDSFGIQVLGFETSYESDFGLHTVCFEEYHDKYKEGWWKQAIQYFKSNNIDKEIYPVVNIDKVILDFYLTYEGG